MIEEIKKEILLNRYDFIQLFEVFLKYRNLIAYDTFIQLCEEQKIYIHKTYNNFLRRAIQLREKDDFSPIKRYLYVEAAGFIWHTKHPRYAARSAAA